MANIIPDNIRRLLLEFTFEADADSMGEDLTCTLCSKLMIDAYQTYCGCKYCRECVAGYLSEGNDYCRGGKEESQEDRLVLDDNVSRLAILNKKILKVQVHCPNRPCAFISPLALMDDHLRVCGQQDIICPFTSIGCGSEGASKDRVETHLNNEMLAHSSLLMEIINNLRNELGALREDLQTSKMEIGLMKEDWRMNDGDIRSQLEVEKDLRRKEMQGLVELMNQQKRDLLERVEEERKMRNHCQEELKELQKQRKKTEEDKRGIISELEERKQDVMEITKKIERLEQDGYKREDGEGAVAAMGVERMRIDELTRTVDSLNVGTNKVVAVGRLWFTLDRLAERVEGEGETVYSPYLYSHANGYKLRLKVLTREEYNEKVYMSVYLSLCRGEYDEVLPWPCRLFVTVSAVNQRTKEVESTDTINYCSSNEYRFNRPIDTDNEGLSILINHTRLRSTDGLVVNDSVLLLLAVTPPPVDIVAFTVDRFSARRNGNETVYSPYFYTHTNGYKLRVEVDPGGRGDERGTHVSVSSVVCRGEDDDTLMWPCRYGITLSLVNQRTNEACITKTNTYSSTFRSYFNKPISTDNEPLEWYKFISHADLDSIEGLLVNDSVLLRIALIPPQ